MIQTQPPPPQLVIFARSSARHDGGVLYWPGGVFVAAVLRYGSGVGASSDLLAARIARATLRRVRRPG